MSEFFILLCMIFFHILDDFHLQGWFANGKQKLWWEKNAPDNKYKHDYLAALVLHSFSWVFMVMLIPSIFTAYWLNAWYTFLFFGNLVIHFIVDDLKANRHKLNLIQDQCIHIIQIIITWYIMIIMY